MANLRCSAEPVYNKHVHYIWNAVTTAADIDGFYSLVWLNESGNTQADFVLFTKYANISSILIKFTAEFSRLSKISCSNKYSIVISNNFDERTAFIQWIFITFRLCFKFIVKLKFQYACIWDGNILKLCTEDNVKLLLAFKIEISSFLYNFTLHLWFFLWCK